MNERIVDLAFKAVAESSGTSDMCIPPEFYQKFAELIVKECANIVSNKVTLETNEDYREGFHRAKQFIWQDIKEHFGVEE